MSWITCSPRWRGRLSAHTWGRLGCSNRPHACKHGCACGSASEQHILHPHLLVCTRGGSTPKRADKWGKFANMNRLVRGKPSKSTPDTPTPLDSPAVERGTPRMVYDAGPPSPKMPHDVPQLELPPSPTRRKVLAGSTNWMQMLRPPKPPQPVVSLQGWHVGRGGDEALTAFLLCIRCQRLYQVQQRT